MRELPPDPHAVPLSDHAAVTDRVSVAVLMQSVPVADNPWLDHRWELVGVLPARHGPKEPVAPGGPDLGHRIVRHDGLTLRLYRDETESYYHNLMSPRPMCYVVSRDQSGEVPRPMLVTASFDEANAYAEGDRRVDATALPAALHATIEAFVLTHFVPTRRAKRKRADWRQT